MLSRPSVRPLPSPRLDLMVEAVSRDLRRRRRQRDAVSLEAALEEFVASILAYQWRLFLKAVSPRDDFGRYSSVGTVDARWREVTRETTSTYVDGVAGAYRASYAVGAGRMVKDLSEALTYQAPPIDTTAIPLDSIGHADLSGTVFDVADPQAIGAARLHAAELVTAVDSGTRAALARVVTSGVAKGQSTDVIRNRLLSGNPAFSRARAQMIAVTETAFAYERGRQATAQTLTNLGLKVEKAWLTEGGARVCPTCDGNESEGWIPENQSFGDGSDVPPAHPNCRCSTERRTVDRTRDHKPAKSMSRTEPPRPTSHSALKSKTTALDASTDVDFMVKQEIKATVAELERDFPTVASKLEVGVRDVGKRTYAETWGHGGMDFSNTRFKHMHRAEAMLEHDVKVGWHPKGTGSIKGLTDHEFGHAVHFMYQGKVDEFLRLELPARMKAMGVRPTIKAKTNSRYGRKDAWGGVRHEYKGYEWFAELFAEARSPLAYEQLSAPAKATRTWLAENASYWQRPLKDVPFGDRHFDYSTFG